MATDPARREAKREAFERRRRRRNLVFLFLLLAFVILVYAMTMVRTDNLQVGG